MTPSQCRAARALLNLEQSQVAEKAGVARATVNEFERSVRTPRQSTIDAIRMALEEDVEFIPENGGGAGVRLKK